MMQTIEHLVANGDGWKLSLFQTWDEEVLNRSRRPVLIVPGYGMNSFIFSYHPRGLSFEGHLVREGFEVWRVDLRAQGGSRSTGGSLEDFSLAELALTDLPAAIDGVLGLTKTTRGDGLVDLIGASLGGTIVMTYGVLAPDPRIGSIVLMGAPVRWEKVHPVIKLAFGSPFVAGLVKFENTRRLAELVLPFLARHTPWVLTFYLNPAITDTSAARELVRTVEDPRRRINRQIAHWIRSRDLIIRGVNVAKGLGRITQPLLCVYANGDGVVPQETARYCFYHVASSSRRLLEVGTQEIAHAHADLFISNEAHLRVFAPIAEWLTEQQTNGAGA